MKYINFEDELHFIYYSFFMAPNFHFNIDGITVITYASKTMIPRIIGLSTQFPEMGLNIFKMWVDTLNNVTNGSDLSAF